MTLPTENKPIPPFLLIIYLGLLFGTISCILTNLSLVGLVIFPLFIIGGFNVGKYGAERDLI